MHASAHSVRGVDQPAGHAVLDLVDDPADPPGDRRPRLPQRLADRQPEPFADRLLQHGGGVHLEGVDLDRADVVQVREDVDVGIAGGVADGLVVEVPALGIVVRHRPDERELDLGVPLLDHAIGVDHAERVLPRIEAGNLRDAAAARRRSRTGRRCSSRPPATGPCSSAPAGRSPAARCAAIGRSAACGHVLAPVEDGGVVARERRVARKSSTCSFGVDRSMWQRQIQRASDVREVVAHRRRLRVVDDDEVVLALEPRGVELVVAPVDLLLLLAQALRVALERVVDRLRHIEELVRAVDDPPLRLEPGVGHERDERVVDLGHAAAEGGRGEVQHALARQRLGEARGSAPSARAWPASRSREATCARR